MIDIILHWLCAFAIVLFVIFLHVAEAHKHDNHTFEEFRKNSKKDFKVMLTDKDINDFWWAKFYLKHNARIDGNNIHFSHELNAQLCKSVLERHYNIKIDDCKKTLQPDNGVGFKVWGYTLTLDKPLYQYTQEE